MAKRLPPLPFTGVVSSTPQNNDKNEDDDDDDLIEMIKRMIIQDQKNDKLLVEHLVDDVMFYKSEIKQKNELIADLMHCLKNEIQMMKQYMFREESMKIPSIETSAANHISSITRIGEHVPSVNTNETIPTINTNVEERLTSIIMREDDIDEKEKERIVSRYDQNKENKKEIGGTIISGKNEKEKAPLKPKLMLRRTSHWHVKNETTENKEDDQTKTEFHTDSNDNENNRDPRTHDNNDDDDNEQNVNDNQFEKKEANNSTTEVVNEASKYCKELVHRVGRCNNELCETTTSEQSAEYTSTDQETDDVESKSRQSACVEVEVFNRACADSCDSLDNLVEDLTNENRHEGEESENDRSGPIERRNSSETFDINSPIVKSQLEALRLAQREKYYANKLMSNEDCRKWPDDTILVVGDSILCGIDEQRLGKKKFVKVRVFPGARLDDFYRYLPPLLDKCPSHIILHAGTNDAPYWTSTMITEKLLKIVSFVESILPLCEVIISYPVLRMDEAKASLTVRKLRNDLNALSLPCITHDNITEKHLGKKGFHLNARGLGRIALNILACIRRL